MGTTLYLVNPTQVGSAAMQLAGFNYDSVNDASLIANIQASGGLLVTGTAPIVAAAANAIAAHKVGAEPSVGYAIMFTALAGQPAAPIGPTPADASGNIDLTLGKRFILPTQTGNRAYTLLSAANSAQGANALFPLYAGARREISRVDTGAFTPSYINGGPGAGTLITQLASKTGKVEIEWDGTNWTLVGGFPS